MNPLRSLQHLTFENSIFIKKRTLVNCLEKFLKEEKRQGLESGVPLFC